MSNAAGMTRRGALALAAGFAAAAGPAGPRATTAQDPARSPVRATWLVDLAQRRALVSEQADARLAPASMTKMLTVFAAFAEVAAGRARLDQRLTAPPGIAQRFRGVQATMGLKDGDRPTIAALIDGLIGRSGNDAAEVLAAGLFGSLPAALAAMDGHRAALGMSTSRFGTVTGQSDGPPSWSTARDLARLAAGTRAGFPALYARFYAARAGGVRGEGALDDLLAAIPGADGLKTGWNAAAGRGAALMAERDGRRLLLVLTGRDSDAQRLTDAATLFDRGFATPLGPPARP
jgi:D-alanyl-D-alanine carboxypeptidase (penicillin-binding protein 5/6)